MTNVYSLDGILVFGLLFVCTCAYFKKVPRLKTWLLSEKKGVWGVFYKAAVIGTRLHAAVAITCVEKSCSEVEGFSKYRKSSHKHYMSNHLRVVAVISSGTGPQECTKKCTE
uniref:Protein kish-B n=1 Tax=Molossus molossus TaxID=27622 RepID=A0A7J8CV53_MOLMO|nr:transmembrane protein 167B [Molossus molossus]